MNLKNKNTQLSLAIILAVIAIIVFIIKPIFIVPYALIVAFLFRLWQDKLTEKYEKETNKKK